MAEKILVPDIGDAADVDVIEVMVSPGDTIAVEDSLITLEGDKATMDVPSPQAGVVESVDIKVGDKASEGSLILTLKVSKEETSSSETQPEETSSSEAVPVAKEETPSPRPEEASGSEAVSDDEGDVHAGPGVRRIAHEFGINLTKIKGTGAKGRVIKEDVQAFVK